MAKTIDDWKLEVMRIMGLKQKQIESTKTPTTPVMNKHATQDPNKVLPKVVMKGSGKSTDRVGKFLSKNLFGSETDRREINELSRKKITQLRDEGMASPIEITSNTRLLKGNFFSAKGHNLKGEDFKPDLSRPVVLLLTGSGGSAEDQGLDMAEMYSSGGASVLSVNYGGYGESTGEPSELSLNQDGQAMLEHLIKLGYKPDQIILHGFSMGATVSATLESSYESKGVKFRGQVQDRPMPSSGDGVKSHAPILKGSLAKLTSKKVGEMSGKGMLSSSDKDTPKVVTTDNKGDFGKRGEKLRDQLEMQGHQVTGTKSSGSHLESDKMIETNREPLLDLVRNTRTGKLDEEVVATRLDLDVLFHDTYNEIASQSNLIAGMIKQADTQKKPELLKTARQKVDELRGMIRQLETTGLRDLERYKTSFLKLDAWKKKYDLYEQQIRDLLKSQTGKDPFASDSLVRLMDLVAEKLFQFEQAGGPDFDNRALEIEIVELGKRAQPLIKDLEDQKEFAKTFPDHTRVIREHLDVIRSIVEARKDRGRQLQENLNSLSGESRTKKNKALEELKESMTEDFKHLKGEGEDVKAKRTIGESSDKGYQKIVVKPVESILPKIEILMKTGQRINVVTLPELGKVTLGLSEALKRYTNKRDDTNKEKDPKDWDQRDRKVKAIEKRIEGLNQIIEKANKQSEKIKEIILKDRPQSLIDLQKQQGVGKVKMITQAIKSDLTTKTGNKLEDNETQKRAKQNALIAGKYLNSLDENQLDQVLKNRIDPKVLPHLLKGIDLKTRKEEVSDSLLNHFGDDEEYLIELLETGIEDEFQSTGEGTKAMRGTSHISNLLSEMSERGSLKEFKMELVEDTLKVLKKTPLKLNKLDILSEKSSKQQIENNKKLAEENKKNIQIHSEIFDKLLNSLVRKMPPPMVAKVAAAVYESALRRYGTEKEALTYVGGFIMLRMISPAISTYFTVSDPDMEANAGAVIQSKILQNLSNNTTFKEEHMAPFNVVIMKSKPMLNKYFQTVVNFGKAAKDGLTVVDFATDALLATATTNAEFNAPNEKDPLGTLPKDPTSVLGHAIEIAREKQKAGDWKQLSQLQKTNQKKFDQLILAARREVLLSIIK